MQRCDRRLEPAVAYRPMSSGMAGPFIALDVRPARGSFAARNGFQVDTGSDVALGLAAPLRNWLRSTGARPRRGAMEWGPAPACEVYDVTVRVEGAWLPFEAFYPPSPTLGENLVGLPVLQKLAVCLRPADEVLHISHGA